MGERKVYLVSRGSYSNYSIEAVFDSLELAELYTKTFPGSGGYDCEPSIETYTLNPLVPEMRAGMALYELEMDRNGEVSYLRAAPDVDPAAVRYVARPYSGGKGLPQRFSVYVLATDEQHAVKIANERRVQMIAMNEWPEDAA
jgi:hypothetical protein